MAPHAVTDDELLRRTRTDADAFGEFYRRHEDAVLAYMLRRTRHADLAADLTAEVFASALASAHRFRSRSGKPAVGWLFGIARNVLGHSVRRQQVEYKARTRLGLPVLQITDAVADDIAKVDSNAAVAAALAGLPADQADLIRARILEDESYDELAARLRCSPQVLRKRVSRGLASLREESRGLR